MHKEFNLALHVYVHTVLSLHDVHIYVQHNGRVVIMLCIRAEVSLNTFFFVSLVVTSCDSMGE